MWWSGLTNSAPHMGRDGGHCVAGDKGRQGREALCSPCVPCAQLWGEHGVRLVVSHLQDGPSRWGHRACLFPCVPAVCRVRWCQMARGCARVQTTYLILASNPTPRRGACFGMAGAVSLVSPLDVCSPLRHISGLGMRINETALRWLRWLRLLSHSKLKRHGHSPGLFSRKGP